jgi:general secretion pathway protein G
MERNIVIGRILEVPNLASQVPSRFAGQLPWSSDKSQIVKRKSHFETGFSLLELMIAMFILIILLTVAIPTYQRTVLQAKETVLEQNLWQMRRSIDQYGSDKGKLPQSLNDLVDGGYLREMPVDPMNEERAEWTEIQGEDKYSGDGSQGLLDVKSFAQGVDGNGKNYSDY